jgi:DNA-binding transcriptional LysR family regulator
MAVMDRLQAMTAFRRVVELKSFSAAAREQRLSSAAVTKQIAALEQHLETRLLNRTTRQVSPTAAGLAYYEQCCRILDDIESVEGSLAGTAGKPQGTLRMNVPMSFGLLHVAPLVPELLELYPELRLELSFTDRFVDVVEEGVDLIIRITDRLQDSDTLVAHTLARARSVVCASPKYLRKHGEPETPLELAQHECIVYSLGQRPGEWVFTGPSGKERVQVKGRYVVNNSLAIRDALLAGAGITLIPAFYVDRELRAKSLRAVLTKHDTPPIRIYGVYQRSRHVPFKVRAVLSFLAERLARAEWAAASS